MSDIFISYASEDRARAKVLARTLERRGFSVWWDREILPGERFVQMIKEALDQTKCIIVLWSKDSIKSKWVQLEAAEGVDREILVPALIDDVEIPFQFKQIHAARLIDWKGKPSHPEFDKLFKAVSAILDKTKSATGSGSTPDEQVKDKQKENGTESNGIITRYKLFVSIALGLAILIALLLYIFKQPVLVFTGEQPVKKTESGYEASFDFDQSKPVPPGIITFTILAEEDDEAKISDVSVEIVGPKVGEDVSDIYQNGKEATLTYQPLGATPHRLKVIVSNVPLTVEITSPQLKRAIKRTIQIGS